MTQLVFIMIFYSGKYFIKFSFKNFTNFILLNFRCEISRVFLLLILKPTRQKMPSDLASVLEKYMWINGNFDSPGNLFIYFFII